MATLFFDLDGTLVDPRTGIVRAFRHALAEVGVAVPAANTLDWVIGPALIDSFVSAGAPDPEAALAAYRACYTSGAMFEAKVYPGIPAALASLRDAGNVLHLATAKPHVYARRITDHYGLNRFLTDEFGPELDGTRNDKGALLSHALARTGDAAETCVMIGDRIHDIRAARAVGMPVVAVGWGYGDQSELMQADAVCAKPEDLPKMIADRAGFP